MQIYLQIRTLFQSSAGATDLLYELVALCDSFLSFFSDVALSPQVSEDDSYPSDVSDNISMDNFSNGTESDRQNSGTRFHTGSSNIEATVQAQ